MATVEDGYTDVGDGLSMGTQTTTYKVFNEDGSVASTKTETYNSTIYTGNNDPTADLVNPETNPNAPPTGTKKPGLLDGLFNGLQGLGASLEKGALIGALALAGVLLLVYAPEVKAVSKVV